MLTLTIKITNRHLKKKNLSGLHYGYQEMLLKLVPIWILILIYQFADVECNCSPEADQIKAHFFSRSMSWVLSIIVFLYSNPGVEYHARIQTSCIAVLLSEPQQQYLTTCLKLEWSTSKGWIDSNRKLGQSYQVSNIWKKKNHHLKPQGSKFVNYPRSTKLPAAKWKHITDTLRDHSLGSRWSPRQDM